MIIFVIELIFTYFFNRNTSALCRRHNIRVADRGQESLFRPVRDEMVFLTTFSTNIRSRWDLCDSTFQSFVAFNWILFVGLPVMFMPYGPCTRN